MVKDQFVNQREVFHQTAASIVGVNRAEDSYKKPIPPETIQKFWGMNPSTEGDDIVKKQTFDKDAEAFWSMHASEGTTKLGGKNQSEEDAAKVFFGIEEKKPANFNHHAPIPGYCGTNRRVNADNIFGMTYAEARRRADDS